MLVLHREWIFADFFAKWLAIVILLDLGSAGVKHIKLLLLGAHVNFEINKAMAFDILRIYSTCRSRRCRTGIRSFWFNFLLGFDFLVASFELLYCQHAIIYRLRRVYWVSRWIFIVSNCVLGAKAWINLIVSRTWTRVITGHCFTVLHIKLIEIRRWTALCVPLNFGNLAARPLQLTSSLKYSSSCISRL